MEQAVLVCYPRTDQPCVLKAQVKTHRKRGTRFGCKLPKGFQKGLSFRRFVRGGCWRFVRGGCWFCVRLLRVRSDPVRIIEGRSFCRFEQIQRQQMAVQISDLPHLVFLVRKGIEIALDRRSIRLLGIQKAVGGGDRLCLRQIAPDIFSEVVEIACKTSLPAKRTTHTLDFLRPRCCSQNPESCV